MRSLFACLRLSILAPAVLAASLALFSRYSAAAEAKPERNGTEFGFAVFQQHCVGCHGNPAYERAPSPATLRTMPPERIYAALTSGVMKSVGVIEDERNEDDQQGKRERGGHYHLLNQCRGSMGGEVAGEAGSAMSQAVSGLRHF